MRMLSVCCLVMCGLVGTVKAQEVGMLGGEQAVVVPLTEPGAAFRVVSADGVVAEDGASMLGMRAGPLKELLSPGSRKMRRITFGSLAIVSAAIGASLEMEVREAAQTYDDYHGYDRSVHDANWERVETAWAKRTAAFGIAGACLGLFILSFRF